MHILWEYLRPHKALILLSLLLAAIAQMLSLIDPIIFGKIIDDYASNPNQLSQDQLVRGVLFWLGVAIAVAEKSLRSCKK
jgi:ATP-binding cassette subfamily B protein